MVDLIIFLIVILMMALALKGSIRHFRGQGSCCTASSPMTSVETKRLDDVTHRMRLVVAGMHCPHCEDRVRKALDGISGAAVESITWKDGHVVLAVNRDVPHDLLRRVIEGEGYHLESVEDF